MQSKRGIIWVVEWTYQKHRICITQAQAEKARTAWKEWKKRQGWRVTGHRAYKKPHVPQICNIVKYDAVTRKVLDVR